MREIQVSDDPAMVRFTPELCLAARALLRWTRADLTRQVFKAIQMPGIGPEIQLFEEGGQRLDPVFEAAVLAVLLGKVEFTFTEGETGVVRKRHIRPGRGQDYVQWAGPGSSLTPRRMLRL